MKNDKTSGAMDDRIGRMERHICAETEDNASGVLWNTLTVTALPGDVSCRRLSRQIEGQLSLIPRREQS